MRRSLQHAERYGYGNGSGQVADYGEQMHEKLPPGITLIKADDFQTWLMDIQVIDSNPIYQGETYRLKFTFSPQYPIEVCPLVPSLFFLHHPTTSPPILTNTHARPPK
jgi:ubiquitin-protein ligase